LKRSGFTLLEILVVLAVVGVLLGLATPSYLRWRANSITNEAALQFASDIERTRTEAKRRNTRMRIELASGTAAKGYLRIDLTSGARTSISLPRGVRLERLGESMGATFFPPYGTTDAPLRSFAVRWHNDAAITRTIRVVGVTGKVIVQ